MSALYYSCSINGLERKVADYAGHAGAAPIPGDNALIWDFRSYTALMQRLPGYCHIQAFYPANIAPGRGRLVPGTSREQVQIAASGQAGAAFGGELL